MPTDQAVAQLMQAYPNVNPKPMVDSIAHLDSNSDSYIGTPPAGLQGSGYTPSGQPPAATTPPPTVGGLAGGSMMPKPMAPPTPVHVPGAQPAQWTDPRGFHNPADVQIRKRSGSLGEILGGLK